MSWIERIKSNITPTRKASIPEGVWTKCDSCGQVLYRAELERNLEVCPKCDHHMRMTARNRLHSLLDDCLLYTSVNFEALRPLAAEEACDAFAQGEDIVLSEENEFPTQVGDASGTPHLSVGCVRNDYGMPEQVQFWSVADNVRFGGALMAVKIAEKLGQEYLY